ncbi:MAG: hypothetical protein JWL81_3320 [Verrucomicrobiales bacterium]|nr:hypothetical protein [Verrucomicrobiales bacterium]
MKTTFSAWLLILLFTILSWTPAGWAGEAAAPAEKAKIESLILRMQTMTDASFVRNGKEYDAKTAARFLRGKWEANSDEIRTAADFIDKAATKSSTSGKPYMIKTKAGVETSAADFLKAELKKIEKPAT